jgi:hypothetical protein
MLGRGCSNPVITLLHVAKGQGVENITQLLPKWHQKLEGINQQVKVNGER